MPLMLAVSNDKLQAVKCLLEHGADPSLQTNHGWNVLPQILAMLLLWRRYSPTELTLNLHCKSKRSVLDPKMGPFR